MRDFVSIFLSCSFLLLYIFCIPYGIWVWITAYRGKWKLVAFQLAYPAVFLAMAWPLSNYLDSVYEAEYLRAVYDTEVTLGKPVYKYDTGRAFNGDGYTIYVYELPPEIRKRFTAVDRRLLTQFPQVPESRLDWSVQYWTPSPFDARFNEYLDFALSSYDLSVKSNLKPYFEAIRKALAGEDAYYAFFARNGDIDFFVVALAEGRLYEIYHNT